MVLSDLTMKKIEHVLDEIIAQQTVEIFDEQNKNLFNQLIKDFSRDDDNAKEILLTLVVNDVFVFLKRKEYLRIEKNIYSCLSSLGCQLDDCKKVIDILKISEKIHKIKRKQSLKKVMGFFIGITVLMIPSLFLINNYCSYYRNSSEKLIKSGNFKILDTEYYVDSFFISEREVTVTDYEIITGINSLGKNSSQPVINVSWYDAVNYCNKLSEKCGLQNVYYIDPNTNIVSADFSKNGYRLPTKVEWYWAAINPDEDASTNFSGADSKNNTLVDLYCWYIKNSDETLHDTCLKRRNKRNLYDMSGNAQEWCWDIYWDWTESREGIQYNPTGPESGIYRSVCGGFFGNSAKYIDLVNSQTKMKPENTELYCGFRVCRSYKKLVKIEEH